MILLDSLQSSYSKTVKMDFQQIFINSFTNQWTSFYMKGISSMKFFNNEVN